jgi:hypothetical protein
MHTETIVFLSQRPIRWIYNVNSREPDHLWLEMFVLITDSAFYDIKLS